MRSFFHFLSIIMEILNIVMTEKIISYPGIPFRDEITTLTLIQLDKVLPSLFLAILNLNLFSLY